MEVILHYMYVVAIKDTRAWLGDSLMQLSMVGFWNLTIIWLKVCRFKPPYRYLLIVNFSCYYPGAFSVCGHCRTE